MIVLPLPPPPLITQHDAQVDYYGRRLATCSSDKTIKIFEIGAKGGQKQVAELVGHEGAVWQLAWAHPKFGALLASCGYDRRVLIWKEEQPGQWRKVHEYAGHELSVNAVAWAPHEQGLLLAAGSSDGHVSVLTWKAPNEWTPLKFHAHSLGVNAVSWAPTATPLAGAAGARLATGGCDKAVRLWQQGKGGWEAAGTPLEGHTDWVRDVQWAPNVGLAHETMASCGQDGQVLVWTRSNDGAAWSKTPLTPRPFEGPVWRLSWSVTGTVLAVSGGDNQVTLWREGLDHAWSRVAALADA